MRKGQSMKNMEDRWGLFFKMMVAVILGVFVISVFGIAQAKRSPFLKIGIKEEPKTLNIWLASDKWSGAVLRQIYQPLYIREPKEMKLVPWLAESAPLFDRETLSYTIKLRPAKWSDGSDLTSEDVAFTGRLIKEFKVPRRSSYWRFIKKIETPDERTVRFFLKKPMAVFTTRTLTTRIVQKKEWEPVIKEARKSKTPLKALLNHSVEKPVGCGPFILKEWKEGAYLFLQKNPNFFGQGKTIGGRTLGPHVRGLIYKSYGTSDAAILALKKGDIDMFLWGIEAGYVDELKESGDIQLFYNERSALYYMGLNARRPPFKDVHFRRAMAELIDKEYIITRLLQGNGLIMHSIIPPGDQLYHNPNVPKYGDGLPKEERIQRAYNILKEAGYSWGVPPVDNAGKIQKGREIRNPKGELIEKFAILTPQADYDPARAMAGVIIQGWLNEMGVPAYSRPMALGSLIDQTKVRQDFDAFILGYGKLSLDPDYLRRFFHSSQDKPRGNNRSGYRNPEFDRIADLSAAAMDEKERQKLVWAAQKIIMTDVPWIPIYNPKLIEAARNDKFKGWVEMLEGIGNQWSFCEIKPK